MNAMESNEITPEVNNTAEFVEIINDFGNPLEILREGIANAIDADAKTISIEFKVEQIEGSNRSVIEMTDDGIGMTRESASRDFWGLGFSTSRGNPEKIGEKGHGTKIYLRSERVEVISRGSDGIFESICERPLAALMAGRLHKPTIKQLPEKKDFKGTYIRVVGYNDNERSKFVKDQVRDYVLWSTKIGSVEHLFGKNRFKDFKVRIKCLDQTEFEEIPFGHPFPKENSDIEKLFDQEGLRAADLYVRRWIWKEQRLKEHPEVTYDVVLSIEGDEAKRQYNPMIRERSRIDTGRYRVSDKYGIYLCKDFIPVIRVNEWISGFGSGSNAFVLIHGFVNCQSLRLTANRGTVANTDPKVLEELRAAVSKLITQVDEELRGNGLYTLRSWQDEYRTKEQEKQDFTSRIKKLKSRRVSIHEKRVLLEPGSEAEAFGLFMILHTMHPDLFDFDIIDYNTTRGIDFIVRNKSPSAIIDGEFHYVELKHKLSKQRFNHTFEHLRWVVCWDFDKGVGHGTEIVGIDEADIRTLELVADKKSGLNKYFLNNPAKHRKIEVIRLRELAESQLGLKFKDQQTA